MKAPVLVYQLHILFNCMSYLKLSWRYSRPVCTSFFIPYFIFSFLMISLFAYTKLFIPLNHSSIYVWCIIIIIECCFFCFYYLLKSIQVKNTPTSACENRRVLIIPSSSQILLLRGPKETMQWSTNLTSHWTKNLTNSTIFAKALLFLFQLYHNL